jgi:hypothetical protein
MAEPERSQEGRESDFWHRQETRLHAADVQARQALEMEPPPMPPRAAVDAWRYGQDAVHEAGTVNIGPEEGSPEAEAGLKALSAAERTIAQKLEALLLSLGPDGLKQEPSQQHQGMEY